MGRDEREIVTAEEREMFDEVMEEVMAALPAWVHELLEEVPVVVEDYPSREVMEEMGVEDPGDLCGLHTGVPLTERGVEHSGVVGDVIHVYRDGVLNASTDRRGRVNEKRLRREVKITVLHEIGHHFGLDEDDLRDLGYG